MKNKEMLGNMAIAAWVITGAVLLAAIWVEGRGLELFLTACLTGVAGVLLLGLAVGDDGE